MRNQILIGLGGTGGKVLKAFRKRLWVDANHDKDTLPIGFIYVDSTDEMMDPNDKSFVVLGKDTHFQPNEFVHIKDNVDLDAILNHPEAYPNLAPIVGNGQLMARTLGAVGTAAGQKRRAGRILFASKCNDFMQTLSAKWNDLSTNKNDTTHSIIHIFTGLAGGTGSGAIIDVVAQIRKDPRFHNPNDTIIVVYAMVPEVDIPAGCKNGRYHQNGFAALRELSAFNAGVFLPLDVLRGRPLTNADINITQLYQFGLMLYSDVNENGTKVKPFTELPELVANAVYTEMFLSAGVDPQIEAFKKIFKFENFVGETVEFNSEDASRARTKAVNTFGIKRIIYPDKRILDHVACTIGIKIINQMLYNNFDEANGYLEQNVTNYPSYLDDHQINKWMLDDEHLMLRKPLVKGDLDWEEFDAYWHTQIISNIPKSDAAHNDEGKSLFQYLEDEAEKKYKREFRGIGVENFYNERKNDQSQSKLLVGKIEATLYQEWKQGNLSLVSISKIIEKLTERLNQRITDIKDPKDGIIVKLSAKIFAKQKVLRSRKDSKINIEALSYSSHQSDLKDLYIYKTQSEAYTFMEWLLSEIVKDLANFNSTIHEIKKKFESVRKSAQTIISDIEHLNNQGVIDDPNVLRKPTIEVYNVNVMRDYEREQIKNRVQQAAYAQIYRDFLENKGNIVTHPLQTELFEKIRNLDTTLMLNDGIRDSLAMEIQSNHDAAGLAADKKVLGLNVLEQIEQLLTDPDKKTKFVKGLIYSCGVYLDLDGMEMIKHIPNNPDPVSNPHTIDRKAWLISIPQIPGGGDYRKNLIDSLKSQILAGRGGEVIAVSDSVEANEMSIMYVRYLFPIRAIRSLQRFAKEYDDMVLDENNTNALEARIILHCEGEGKQLPYLMGEPVLSNDDYLPYLFLASAFGYLEYGDDIEGKKGWCSIVEDEFGVENRLKLSDTFTGITSSTLVTNVILREFMNKVNGYLNSHTFFDSEKTKFCNLINATMKQYVAREFPNPNTTDYKKYADAARTAKSLIK